MDGKRIIFNSYRNDSKYLRVCSMNSDGSNIQLISNPELNYSESYASYSPDDSKIVFVRWLENRNGEIYVMNSDGTDPINLTNHNGFDGYPCWSGNGERIIFSSNRSGSFKLYSIDISGDNLSKLISETSDYAEVRANCVKDDSIIAFNMQDREGNIRIHLMKKIEE
jgi:TolB protein